MKRVFIVHRWDGSSKSDWISWLKMELEKLGYVVVAPDMPDAEAPVIEKWVSHLAGLVGQADSETYFIGHSIGCQTILRYLQTQDFPVAGAVFVAGWFALPSLESAEEKLVAQPWLTTPIDFENARKALSQSVTILSDNDPYVPLNETRQIFKKKLGSEVIVISRAGHFTEEDGFTKLPEVLIQFQKMAAT